MKKAADDFLEPKIERISIRDIRKDPKNVRVHGERNKKAISASLKRFGPGRSLVIDGQGVVRAGNGTLEEAEQLGMTEVIIVEPGRDQLVAVRRSDWSEEEAAGYAIADNRSQDLSAFDDEALGKQLEALNESGLSLDDLGFSREEIEAGAEPDALEVEEELSPIRRVHILISMGVDEAVDLLPQIEALAASGGAQVRHAGN